MSRLRYNALQSTLGAPLTAGGTTITFSAALAYQQGVAVPTLTGSDYIPLTIDPATPLEEVVSLTAYTSGATTGTITRGVEGAGVAHATGHAVICAPTAADYNGLEQTANKGVASGYPGLDGSALVPLANVPRTVVVPAATGVVATDTANLAAALAAAPLGGLIRGSGHYKINAALSVTQNVTIEGDSTTPTFASVTSGGSTSEPVSPFLAGMIIEQTVAATDIIDCFASAVTLNLRRVGLLFTAGLASTGHGVNCTPSQTYGSGHDMGLTGFHWEDVVVFGHDGNHYAYVWLNPQIGTLVNLQSYGGGHSSITCDAGSINAGNMTFFMPYGSVQNAGTANGIQLSSAVVGVPGQLNLLTFVRPQMNISGAAHTAGTQLPFNANGGAVSPKFVTVIDCDFEGLGAGNQPVFGTYTQVLGSPLVDGGNGREAQGVRLGNTAGAATAYNVAQFVAVGYAALAAQTSGQFNTAVGYLALSDLTTASSSTAFGNTAAQHQTGAQNTAVGAGALQGSNGASSGTLNTAIGYDALQSLTTGTSDVGVGMAAMGLLTTGSNNVAVGYAAGQFTNGSNANAIVAGNSNTFIGHEAGGASGDPSNSVAIGYQAITVTAGTAVGYSAHATAAGTAIGTLTQATAAGAIAIGYDSAGTAATSGTADLAVIGTTRTTLQVQKLTVPGLGAFATGDKYVIVDSSGHFHISALGPAS